MAKEDCRSCFHHKYWGKKERCRFIGAWLKYEEDGTVLAKIITVSNSGKKREYWQYVNIPCLPRRLLVH